MTTTTQQRTTPRWVLVFLAALIAALAAILAGNLSPASAAATAETRVRASASVVDVLVEPPQAVSAGERLGNDGPRVVDAVATGVAANTAAKVCSFAGSTTVLMADGTRKPIEDVEVGDEVIATDPETGEQVAKTVEHVFVHDDTVIDLVVDGEVITTTEDHPFWSVTDQRFERADELSPGEKVLGADGRVITVSGLQLGTAREALAYNLSVEGIHTYHVGDAEILVHNQCVIPSKSNYRKLFTDAHPNMPANYQVHHALPQKYEAIMNRAGVNIHDPSMLRGVDPAIHSKITTAWGRWERGLGRTPTAHDITQFSYRIDEMYGSSFVW